MAYTKVSQNFLIVELVPPSIHNTYGDNSIWFISKENVKMIQFIRTFFGRPMTINNWHSGGPYTERGFRLPNSTTGSALSDHKRSIADDFNINSLHPNEIRESILKNPRPFMDAGLTTLEHEAHAPTWVHASMRWTGLDKILIVKPSAVGLLGENIESDEYYIWEKGELIPFEFKK